MTMHFQFLTGDLNWQTYGGKFVSKRLNNGEFDYWLVMDILNWEEVDREAVKTQGQYCVSLYSVSPSEAGPENLRKAAESCGMTGDEDCLRDPIAQVDVLASYGVYAQLWSASGNNLRKLMKEARNQAMLASGLYGFYMDRAQNRIGSTGWDVQRGNLLAGLDRHQA